MRKATAVKLTPKDSCDKINVDGEVSLCSKRAVNQISTPPGCGSDLQRCYTQVLDGKKIEVRVLPRIFKCFIANGLLHPPVCNTANAPPRLRHQLSTPF
jgi:hypothetical protein